MPDLRDALRVLRQARWIDLTHPFAPGIPHYAGFPDERRERLTSRVREMLLELIERRAVAAVGHEQNDTDPGLQVAAGRADAEAYVLSAGRWQIELLAGLGQVPQRGALLLASWPRPAGGLIPPAGAARGAPVGERAG